jgi:hypothetical protein
MRHLTPSSFHCIRSNEREKKEEEREKEEKRKETVSEREECLFL